MLVFGGSYLGPDLGARTTGDSIRFPDALTTRTKFPDTERIAPDVVVIFEVLSPNSGRRNRIEKVHEYQAVPSMRRFVIVASATGGPLVEILALPEVGIEIPVSELYEEVDFSEASAGE